MEEKKPPDQSSTEGDSLEGSATPATPPGGPIDATKDGSGATKIPKKKGGGLFSKFSVYLLLFAFVLIVGIMVAVVAYEKGNSKVTPKVTTQTLSQGSLNQLANSDVTVGQAKQVLNVQSNAVFAGQVLIQSDLQVAGKLQVGGTLSLTNIQVADSAIIGTGQINKNLQVAGDTALQGQLTTQKNLSVGGTGTFNGAISAPQVTTSSLQLISDLTLTHHIVAGGASPSRSNGTALGSGGTASVSGSDTAGSITINTGSSPAAGCFLTVTFNTKYDSPPHVIVTPIGSDAGGLGYYVNRTSSSFSVCTATAAPSGANFGFDYIIFG